MAEARAKIDLFILFFLHQVGSKERKEDINVIRYHYSTTACLKVSIIYFAITNITKIVQIVGVASEREAKLETKGMDQCTMIHSNFSM